MTYKELTFTVIKKMQYFVFSVASAKACVRGLRAFAGGKTEGLKNVLISRPF